MASGLEPRKGRAPGGAEERGTERTRFVRIAPSSALREPVDAQGGAANDLAADRERESLWPRTDRARGFQCVGRRKADRVTEKASLDDPAGVPGLKALSESL